MGFAKFYATYRREALGALAAVLVIAAIVGIAMNVAVKPMAPPAYPAHLQWYALLYANIQQITVQISNYRSLLNSMDVQQRMRLHEQDYKNIVEDCYAQVDLYNSRSKEMPKSEFDNFKLPAKIFRGICQYEVVVK